MINQQVCKSELELKSFLNTIDERFIENIRVENINYEELKVASFKSTSIQYTNKAGSKDLDIAVAFTYGAKQVPVLQSNQVYIVSYYDEINDYGIVESKTKDEYTLINRLVFDLKSFGFKIDFEINKHNDYVNNCANYILEIICELNKYQIFDVYRKFFKKDFCLESYISFHPITEQININKENFNLEGINKIIKILSFIKDNIITTCFSTKCCYFDRSNNKFVLLPRVIDKYMNKINIDTNSIYMYMDDDLIIEYEDGTKCIESQLCIGQRYEDISGWSIGTYCDHYVNPTNIKVLIIDMYTKHIIVETEFNKKKRFKLNVFYGKTPSELL